MPKIKIFSDSLKLKYKINNIQYEKEDCMKKEVSVKCEMK